MLYMMFSSGELCERVAAQAKKRRLALRMRQIDVANAAGVTLSTLKRFERNGKVGFEIVAAIAVALDSGSEFLELFQSPAPRTIDEMLASASTPARIRRSSQ